MKLLLYSVFFLGHEDITITSFRTVYFNNNRRIFTYYVVFITGKVIVIFQTVTDNNFVSLLLQPYMYLPYAVFGPVVEIPNESSFIVKNPYDMLVAGEFLDKPLILSLTEREGLAPAACKYHS